MAIDKLTPRYLNKDNDERLIKPVEMTDALNVRISTEDDGDAMVLKNAYGNTEITLNTALPAGTNKVIGSVAVEQSGSIYYFVWNSNDNHCIYKYSTGNDSASQVYKDSVLEFSRNGFVKGNVIITESGDELLYFNDSLSDPKKINASKALRNEYPAKFYNGTDEEKLLFLTVAKQPPLKAPTYNIVNNPNVKDNRIKEKVFQFAYKYVYADGEHSALSPYSSAAVSVAQLRDGFNTESAKDFYNQIDVYVRHSVADVDKIVVYARNGNSGVFYEIDEIDNNGTSNVHTVNFTNSVIGSALSETETQKLYDNVPQLADSQEIVSGRLMYGGYTEGYPNIDSDVNLIPNYKYVDDSLKMNFTYGATYNVNIDYSGLPSVFDEDRTLHLNLHFNADKVTITDTAQNYLDISLNVYHSDEDGTNSDTTNISRVKNGIVSGITPLIIRESISVSAGDTLADVKSALYNLMHNKMYTTKLYPLANGDSLSTLNASGTSWFTAEGGEFKGELTFRCVAAFNGSSLIFNADILDVYLVSFFKGANKQDIIRAGRAYLNNSDSSTSFVASFTGKTLYSTGVFLKDIDVSKTFKSGSSHKLGIVYYDDRNRSTGVQELGDVFIEPLNNRSDENNLKGASSVVMRINHTPPSFAKKWAPVYVGKGQTESKFIYGIGGAFNPINESGSLFSASTKRIYLSLNTLFNKKDSYTEAFNAGIEYAYEPGDMLRIISYGNNSVSNKTFRVVGFETLVDDVENPIFDESTDDMKEYTTGDFLIIEENTTASGFTIKDIEENTSNWFDKCVIEVYNSETSAKQNIYYEIGSTYDVSNGVHVDDRVSATLDLSITSSVSGDLEGNTLTRIFKGDTITVGSNTITIGNVYKNVNTYYFYATDKSITPLAVGSYSSATVTNTDKVIEVSNGDAYLRPRLIFAAGQQILRSDLRKMPGYNGIVSFIDDYSVSDFFDSKSSSIGRPIAYIPNAETLKRKGSITYSDTYVIDAYKNGLSSFNLSLANFKDFAYEHGSIKSLVGYNQKLYFIQEDRCGSVAVNRNVITTAQGDNLVALSTNILQSEQYYAGNYGTQNPESVAHKDGNVYFVDANAGKVVSLGNSGMTLISDTNMESYFTDKFDIISNNQPKLMPSGIDSENDEYIISTDEITEARVIVNSGEYEYKATLDSTGTQVLAQTSYNPSAVFSFSTDVRDFDDMCDNFDNSLGAVVYLDELANGAPIYVSQPFQTSNLYGIATNKTYDFFIAINVNMFLPGFTFDNGYCDTDDEGSISTGSVVLNSFATAYSIKNRVWTTEYSYVPEDIVSVHNTMFSFKNGKIYKHVETANRNTFYGAATAESVVEVVSRKSPSAIKTFESLSLEGNAAWDAVISTTNQSATIDDTSFKEKEGMYYTYVHGSTTSRNGITDIVSTTSTNEFFGLGVVDSVSNDTITFKNNIASMSFPLGATSYLYKINGSQLDALSLTASSISGVKDLTCNATVSNVVQNDVIVLVADSAVEGDQIRDYYAKIRLTKTDTNPVELFAINAVVADSKAHN